MIRWQLPAQTKCCRCLGSSGLVIHVDKVWTTTLQADQAICKQNAHGASSHPGVRDRRMHLAKHHKQMCPPEGVRKDAQSPECCKLLYFSAGGRFRFRNVSKCYGFHSRWKENAPSSRLFLRPRRPLASMRSAPNRTRSAPDLVVTSTRGEHAQD